MSRTDCDIYEQRRDVRKVEQYWDLPVPDDSMELMSTVLHQLSHCFHSFASSNLFENAEKMAQDIDWGTGQPEDIRSTLNVVLPLQSQIAVILDKNVKRRAFADKEGYLYRLAKNYLNDPKHYTFRVEESPETFLQRKIHLFERYVPQRYRKRMEYDYTVLQYAYLNYKNKCHGESSGLVCGKSHAHDREVVSDAGNP